MKAIKNLLLFAAMFSIFSCTKDTGLKVSTATEVATAKKAKHTGHNASPSTEFHYIQLNAVSNTDGTVDLTWLLANAVPTGYKPFIIDVLRIAPDGTVTDVFWRTFDWYCVPGSFTDTPPFPAGTNVTYRITGVMVKVINGWNDTSDEPLWGSNDEVVQL